MNFLAHIFLSGEENDLLKLGNFMGDTIRGKQYLDYPEEVQRGILLHRQIDTFTDAHPLFRESKRRWCLSMAIMRGWLQIFSMIISWPSTGARSLRRISMAILSAFMHFCRKKKEVLNPQMQSIAGYMMRDNWLKAYQTYTGLARILYQMDRRTEFRSQMQYAITSLQTEEPLFEAEFLPFFKEIQEFVITIDK